MKTPLTPNRGRSPAADPPLVFIADADLTTLAAMQLMLEGSGIASRVFVSGSDLIDHLSVQLPACVIADTQLPDMPELSLIHNIHTFAPGLAIILLASNSDVSSAVRSIDRGATDFIEKPFVDRVLLERLQRVL